MRIGHLSTFYHTAMILMAGNSPLAHPVFDADWKLFSTGPSIVNAFEKNELDLAYIGLPPAIIGIERGVEIKCVAGGHIEGTVISGTSRYKGHPEADDLGEILGQFAGLNIGVPGKGSIHDVILNDCLKKFGLENKITVKNFQWADMVLEAVVKEEVSAAFGTPALAAAVKHYAGGKILYPPSLLWPSNPSYGILVSTRFLDEHREKVEAFLLKHEEAAEFIRHSPQEAARVITAYVGFVDEELVLDTLGISPKYCAQLTDEYISSTMKFVKTLKELGYIKQEIAEKEIFDTSIIQKIHGTYDHYLSGIA